MTETDGIHYASNVDEKHAAKVSAARVVADKANAAAQAGIKPWSTHCAHHDVDDATAKGFTVEKILHQACLRKVYVDGKLAADVYETAAGVLIVNLPKAAKPGGVEK